MKLKINKNYLSKENIRFYIKLGGFVTSTITKLIIGILLFLVGLGISEYFDKPEIRPMPQKHGGNLCPYGVYFNNDEITKFNIGFENTQGRLASVTVNLTADNILSRKETDKVFSEVSLRTFDLGEGKSGSYTFILKRDVVGEFSNLSIDYWMNCKYNIFFKEGIDCKTMHNFCFYNKTGSNYNFELVSENPIWVK